MVYAIGIQIGDFPPRPIAIGMSPMMVVREVRTIGRNRTLPPFKIAYHSVVTPFSVCINEVDKNNGIVHHNSRECNDTKHRDDA